MRLADRRSRHSFKPGERDRRDRDPDVREDPRRVAPRVAGVLEAAVLSLVAEEPRDRALHGVVDLGPQAAASRARTRLGERGAAARRRGPRSCGTPDRARRCRVPLTRFPAAIAAHGGTRRSSPCSHDFLERVLRAARVVAGEASRARSRRAPSPGSSATRVVTTAAARTERRTRSKKPASNVRIRSRRRTILPSSSRITIAGSTQSSALMPIRCPIARSHRHPERNEARVRRAAQTRDSSTRRCACTRPGSPAAPCGRPRCAGCTRGRASSRPSRARAPRRGACSGRRRSSAASRPGCPGRRRRSRR